MMSSGSSRPVSNISPLSTPCDIVAWMSSFCEMLAETMQDAEARRWLLERRVNENTVGVGLADDLRAHLMEIDADALSLILMGGLSKAELPIKGRGLFAPTLRPEDFVLPPLPNHLFTRDTTCWIGGGVTLNPMRWNARKLETVNITAIYRFHPDFSRRGLPGLVG